MKAKHSLLLLLIGFFCCMAGALLKIMHWPAADILLLAGLGCEVVAGLIFLLSLLRQPKNN